jgi:hypothetical protein
MIGKPYLRRQKYSSMWQRIKKCDGKHRNLRIKEGRLAKVAFEWESIWLIPEE